MRGTDKKDDKVDNIGIFLSCVGIFVSCIGVFISLNIDLKTKHLAIIVPVLVIATFVANKEYRKKLVSLLNEYSERLNGPDLVNYNYVIRFFYMVFGSIYRSVIRLHYSPFFWVLFISSIVGGIICFSHENLVLTEDGFFKKTNTSSYYASVIAGTCFLSAIGYWFIRKFIFELEDQNPQCMTEGKILWAFSQSYSKEIKVSEYRRKIAVHDTGPIIVVSATAQDLLRPIKNVSAFEEAWNKNENKEFHLLLGDPTSKYVIDRNRRINGRFIEYYAIPYLKMMFLAEEENLSGKKRIKLKGWSDELEYRTILSNTRLMMQNYARFSHGWQNRPYIIQRVIFSEYLEQLNQKGGCDELKNCLLKSGNGAQNYSDLNFKHPTIYSYYSKIINDLYKRTEYEKFLTDWQLDRLRKFATNCGVKRKILKEHKNNSQELANAICKRLDILPQYEKIRSLRETTSTTVYYR